MTPLKARHQTFKRSKLALMMLAAGSSPALHSGAAPVEPFVWSTQEINETFKVSSILDAGTGSIREAIQRANESPGIDQIIFDNDEKLFNQPQTIYLESPLPEITDDLVIDGYIEGMLWKASGVILNGQNQHQILNIAKGSSVKIKYLSLSNGYADKGGAIFSSGNLVIEGSMLSGNTAKKSGGAVYTKGTNTVIYNTTFYENSAGNNGGAITFWSGENRLTNTTLSKNSAPSGGAVFNKSDLSINNSILANSTAGKDCHSEGAVIANNRNIIEEQEGCGNAYSSDDPLIGKPGYFNGPAQTLPLGKRSPATNYGNNMLAVNENGQPLRWDQRGNGDPRNAAGITDIGAFETQAQNQVRVDTIEDVDYRWCTVFQKDCSLKGALLISNNDPRFPVITFLPDLFDNDTTMDISGQLPQIKTQITLDASDTQGITLKLDKNLNPAYCSHNSLLTLNKVSIECDKL